MRSLLEFYHEALAFAQSHNFEGEPFMKQVEWQRKINFDDIDAKQFFWEYTWVVLASGFKAKIAREFHDAFYKSGNGIPERCDISKLYNNLRKRSAIQWMQQYYRHKFEDLKRYDREEYQRDKHSQRTLRLALLKELAFIGSRNHVHVGVGDRNRLRKTRRTPFTPLHNFWIQWRSGVVRKDRGGNWREGIGD